MRRRVTPQAWAALDGTADRILGSPHVAWLVVALVLAAWHVSALVRAASGALDSIFRTDERRPRGERLWKSIVVALAVIVLTSLAVLVVVGGRMIEWHGFAGVLLAVGRWLVAAVVTWALLAVLTGRFRPRPPHARWVSIGAGLAIGGWIAASIVFGLHVGTSPTSGRRTGTSSP